MKIIRPHRFNPRQLARWHPRRRLPGLRGNGRLTRPLAAAGGIAALTIGAAATALVAGGLLVIGLGLITVGAIVVGVYWFRAKRNGIWLHVLVDTDDVVISLAIPIPLSLLHQALKMSPASDDTAQMVRQFLKDPEVMETLHREAIEIVVDSGADHVEVVIGPRRKHWRAIQFSPVRSFSRTESLSNPEETHYV